MRIFLLVAILALFAVGIHAAYDDDVADDYDEEYAIEVPDDISVEEACQPGICARSYEPLCLTINGLMHTANSMCELEGHLRCLLAKARDSPNLPKVEFLYEGQCSAEIYN